MRGSKAIPHRSLYLDAIGTCERSNRWTSTYHIWKDASAKQRFGSMAFKTFKTKREAISLSQLGEGIAAARKIAGDIVVPRNSGLRRTEAKRKLIDQISRNGGNW